MDNGPESAFSAIPIFLLVGLRTRIAEERPSPPAICSTALQGDLSENVGLCQTDDREPED